MKISMNMLLWTTHCTEKEYPLYEDLKKAGFDGVEIPIFQGEESDYKKTKSELDKVGLLATAVTGPDADHNPISPDSKIRQKAYEYIKWAADMSAILDSRMLCGPFHSAFKVFSGKGPTEDEKKWSAEVMGRLAEDAKTMDMILAPEYLNRFECYFMNTVAQAKDLVKRVNHPNLKLMYDTHHANIEETDPEAAIKDGGKDLVHVHISENNRGVPGQGQVRWEETFRGLKSINYDGWLTIESFSRLDPEFAANIHIWRDFFKSPDEVYTEGIKFIKKSWN